MHEISNVLILGGGSAGWLTAGRIAAQLQQCQPEVQVRLVESPNLATIGVGEGSWPSLRHTLRQIGISEQQFLVSCQASYKQGSKFIGWRNNQSNDAYYHPFTNPTGYNELNLVQHWQTNKTASFADSFCVQPSICEVGLAPKQQTTPDYAHVLNYGYHFDADKLAALLTEHCTQKLGVVHIRDHIEAVETYANGDIKALIGQQSGPLEADLFIDCSGMAARLIEKHYGVKWHSVSEVLPVNSALASQVPYAATDAPIQSTTHATAKAKGWVWDIGLYHRRGVGFAYAQEHCSDEEAHDTLYQHLKAQLPEDKLRALTFRKLSFNPGYREKFWHNNCLAIGMCAGFIEPLEASAIAMVELSINMLCEEFPRNREHMELLSKRFNKRFAYRWQRVIDFVKLHYVLSERQDSDFWRHHRLPESIPESLQTLLQLWRYQAPSRLDFIENEEVFPSTSYQYILYGMGFESDIAKDTPYYQSQARAAELQRQTELTRQKYQQGLPQNRELLTFLHQNHKEMK